jgi:hypothetical protein
VKRHAFHGLLGGSARGGRAGNVAKAVEHLARAKADITAALAWFEKQVPRDERTIGIYREGKARIDGL